MSKTEHCESCAMPIDGGRYCQYCVDENGELQPFEVRFEKMVQWMKNEQPTLSREEAENQTRAAMRTMPAWKDHPELK